MAQTPVQREYGPLSVIAGVMRGTLTSNARAPAALPR